LRYLPLSKEFTGDFDILHAERKMLNRSKYPNSFLKLDMGALLN
jgi:hypothetical protein